MSTPFLGSKRRGPVTKVDFFSLINKDEEKMISPHEASLQFKFFRSLFMSCKQLQELLAPVTSSKNNGGGA